MDDRIYNVLFLCTGNSARSIIAEALLNREGQRRFRAYSAGSHPKGDVHPAALDLLERNNFKIENLRSKSWAEFAGENGPPLDFVFTVCDNAAGEACPVWPGQPMSAHWGIEDPAAVEGPEQRAAFERALHYLRNRIALFTALPLASIDKMSLADTLSAIGREEGATERGERR